MQTSIIATRGVMDMYVSFVFRAGVYLAVPHSALTPFCLDRPSSRPPPPRRQAGQGRRRDL